MHGVKVLHASTDSRIAYLDDKLFISWNGSEFPCERLSTKNKRTHVNDSSAERFQCGSHVFVGEIFAIADTKGELFDIRTIGAIKETYKCRQVSDSEYLQVFERVNPALIEALPNISLFKITRQYETFKVIRPSF
jgi:hypothetical protein